jgi:hypothetical protein
VPTRAGKTRKLSISLDENVVARLRKRAKRVSGGNVSALIGDAVERALLDEGREALAAWLLEAHQPSAEELEAVYTEWRGEKPRKRRRRSAA